MPAIPLGSSLASDVAKRHCSTRLSSARNSHLSLLLQPLVSQSVSGIWFTQWQKYRRLSPPRSPLKGSPTPHETGDQTLLQGPLVGAGTLGRGNSWLPLLNYIAQSEWAVLLARLTPHGQQVIWPDTACQSVKMPTHQPPIFPAHMTCSIGPTTFGETWRRRTGHRAVQPLSLVADCSSLELYTQRKVICQNWTCSNMAAWI